MVNFVEECCWRFLHNYQNGKISDILWFTEQLEKSWKKFMNWYYELVEKSGTIRLYNVFQIYVNMIIIVFYFESIIN